MTEPCQTARRVRDTIFIMYKLRFLARFYLVLAASVTFLQYLNSRWLKPALGWSYHQPLLRGLSLLLACLLFAWFSIWPASLMHLPHSILSLVMLGLSGCFVHGVGFEPVHPVPKLIFSPLLCWPLLLLALFF
jgi:predicted membrane protein